MPNGEDTDRFGEFYEAHVDALFAYALSRTSPDRATEAVEETFVVVWRRFEQLPAEPRPWLFGVARKVLSHQRRAGARQAALDQRAVSCAAGGSEPDHADQIVEQQCVLGALARLKEGDRELLCLNAWGRLAPDEVARVLGCTRAALSVRLHRARKRFEAALVAQDSQADAAQGQTTGSSRPQAQVPGAAVSKHHYPTLVTTNPTPATVKHCS